MKSIPEGINNWGEGTEEWISDLEDRMVEISKLSSKRKKNFI